MSAGTERGKLAGFETVGADTAGKEDRIAGTVGSGVGDFIRIFAMRQGISGTIGFFNEFDGVFIPVGEEINFGKLVRL